MISLSYLEHFRGLGGCEGRGKRAGISFVEFKVNSTKSHICFLQGRVTHIYELIYGSEILLEENISESKKN